jgi:hypothetical protein
VDNDGTGSVQTLQTAPFVSILQLDRCQKCQHDLLSSVLIRTKHLTHKAYSSNFLCRKTERSIHLGSSRTRYTVNSSTIQNSVGTTAVHKNFTPRILLFTPCVFYTLNTSWWWENMPETCRGWLWNELRINGALSWFSLQILSKCTVSKTNKTTLLINEERLNILMIPGSLMEWRWSPKHNMTTGDTSKP